MESVQNMGVLVIHYVTVRGASKIKLKNVNKKRIATARRLIFLEFLKASIADLITLFFSLLQTVLRIRTRDPGLGPF